MSIKEGLPSEGQDYIEIALPMSWLTSDKPSNLLTFAVSEALYGKGFPKEITVELDVVEDLALLRITTRVATFMNRLTRKAPMRVLISVANRGFLNLPVAEEIVRELVDKELPSHMYLFGQSASF